MKKSQSKGRMTKEGHVTLSTSIPAELSARLDHEAQERNIEKKLILIAALKEFFDPERNNQVQQTLNARFHCLERRLDSVDWYLNVLLEAQALFVKVWFTNTGEVPVELQDAAVDRGWTRFGKFKAALRSKLRGGGLLVRRQPSTDWESDRDGRLILSPGPVSGAETRESTDKEPDPEPNGGEDAS